MGDGIGARAQAQFRHQCRRLRFRRLLRYFSCPHNIFATRTDAAQMRIEEIPAEADITFSVRAGASIDYFRYWPTPILPAIARSIGHIAEQPCLTSRARISRRQKRDFAADSRRAAQRYLIICSLCCIIAVLTFTGSGLSASLAGA